MVTFECQAHFKDKDGTLRYPEDRIEIDEDLAKVYQARNWGYIKTMPKSARVEEKKAEPKVEEPEAVAERAVIETPEDFMVEHETATVKRKKKR